MIYPVRRIVAGIATLEDPDPVLAPAATLARRTGAELHLVHAYDRPDLLWAAQTAAGMISGPTEQDIAASVQARLEERAGTVESQVRLRCHTEAASPANAILAVAARVEADLVVVGPTRHRRIARVMLGTTAQRVLRRAPVPVLVARGPSIARLERVLLATDLSDFSAGVHEAGLDLVESIFAGDWPDLRLLFVVSDGHGLTVPEFADLLERTAREQLSTFLDQRRPRGRPVEPAIRFGDPADEIAAEVDAWNADLLVVGRHDDGAAMRILLGSVAEAAIREARCSVLVVPSGVEERRRLPVSWSDAHPDREPRGAG